MNRQQRQKQWQWMVGLVTAIVYGLLVTPGAHAITSCPTGTQIMSVGFTPDQSIRVDFLDTKPTRSSWTLISRAKNTGNSSVSYQITINVAGKTCMAGPASLSSGATGTKNCQITPEYSSTGRYTLIATASGQPDPPVLEWKYLICQNP